MVEENITLWFIACSTGCTCCSSDNFVQGPYKTKEEADNQEADWLAGKNNPLASQYAANGRYHVFSREAEPISAGRYIIGNRVIDGDRDGLLLPGYLFQGASYDFDC